MTAPPPPSQGGEPDGLPQPPAPVPYSTSPYPTVTNGNQPRPGVPPGVHQDPDAGAHLMTYTEHLVELRDRLVKSVIALITAMAVSFAFTPLIFDFLKAPVTDLRLIRTGVAEMLVTYMKVALISGLVLSTPVWMYQLIMFVAPGLTRQEKRYLYSALPGLVASFIIGVGFGYLALLPPALGFLVHFGEEIAEPYIRVGDYVSTVVTLLFWIGVIFEMPLVIFILARVGVVTPEVLKAKRKYAIVGAFVAAAVITPTWDPVNQVLVAVPIIVLYEIGVLLSHAAARARGNS